MKRRSRPQIHLEMAEQQLACKKSLNRQLLEVDNVSKSLSRDLQLNKQKAPIISSNQSKILKLQDYVNDLEAALQEVKACKEAKHISTLASLTAVRSKREDLGKEVQEQCSKREKYKRILAERKNDMEVLMRNSKSKVREIEEAIFWYNIVLGFQIEGGSGVKFIFNKVDTNAPEREFSFTIFCNNDSYTLSDCIPCVDGIEDLLSELNDTDDLYEFIRAMRGKFSLSASIGLVGETSSSNSLCHYSNLNNQYSGQDEGFGEVTMPEHPGDCCSVRNEKEIVVDHIDDQS